MGKTKPKYPRVKRIEIKAPEIQDFLKRLQSHALLNGDYETIQGKYDECSAIDRTISLTGIRLPRLHS